MVPIKLSSEKLNGANGAVVVRAEGELATMTCTALDKFLTRCALSGAKRIVFDLSKVTFLNSAAIGVLIEAVERARVAGGWFGLVGGSEAVCTSIDMLGLTDYFQHSGSAQELLRRLSPPRRTSRLRRRPSRRPASRANPKR